MHFTVIFKEWKEGRLCIVENIFDFDSIFVCLSKLTECNGTGAIEVFSLIYEVN